jgi:hypothetical protein
MKMKKTLLIIVWLITLKLKAQDFKQTIRGSVIDKNLLQSIAGAIVFIDGDSALCDTSDITGNFEIKNVSVGRHSILIQHRLYNDATLTDILLNSG